MNERTVTVKAISELSTGQRIVTFKVVLYIQPFTVTETLICQHSFNCCVSLHQKKNMSNATFRNATLYGGSGKTGVKQGAVTLIFTINIRALYFCTVVTVCMFCIVFCTVLCVMYVCVSEGLQS